MRAYSFSNLTSYINGTQISGFDEGDSVLTVEKMSKPSTTVGADGIMVVSIPASKHGKVELTLQATSQFNFFLQSLYDLQEAGTGTFVPIQFQARDSYREDVFVGINGVITDPPKIERGEKAGKHTWGITFEKVRIVLANPLFAGLASATAEASGAL